MNYAFGAGFDHSDLIVAGVIGDGESETGRSHGVAVPEVAHRKSCRVNLALVDSHGRRHEPHCGELVRVSRNDGAGV